MLPPSAERVPRQTPEEIQKRILEYTEGSVARHACGGPEAIERRLRELDGEWDTERALEANFGALVLAGSLFGILRRRWTLLPLIAGGFMVQHALQGWCPPLSLLRRLGYRTRKEIESERIALKALRGDFRDLPESQDVKGPAAARQALEAVRR